MEHTSDTRVTERQIRETLWPVSAMTIWRVQRRDSDPFPTPQKIGGRNYWRLADVRAWLDRQGGGTQAANA